jgi:hypothetical protein
MKIYQQLDPFARFSRAFFLVAMGFTVGHIMGYAKGHKHDAPIGDQMTIADEGMCFGDAED